MTITSATVVKQDDTKFGIIFCRRTRQSPLTIQAVLPDGAFYGNGLIPGMVVTAVNGKRVQWETPVDAAMMLQNTQNGTEASVSVETFVAKVNRASTEQRWGLYLKRPKGASGVIIGKISDLFKSTTLKEGMMIIEINGQPCPKRARDAFHLLKSSQYEMQITAVDLDHVDVDMNWPDAETSTKKKGVIPSSPAVKAPGVTACALDGYVRAALDSIPSPCAALPSRLSEDHDPLNKSDPSLNSMRGMKSLVFPLSKEYKSKYSKERGEDESNVSSSTKPQSHKSNQKPQVKRKKLSSFFQILKEKEIADTSSETSSMEEGKFPRTAKLHLREQRDEDVVPERKRKSIFKKLRRFRKGKSRAPARVQ